MLACPSMAPDARYSVPKCNSKSAPSCGKSILSAPPKEVQMLVSIKGTENLSDPHEAESSSASFGAMQTSASPEHAPMSKHHTCALKCSVTLSRGSAIKVCIVRLSAVHQIGASDQCISAVHQFDASVQIIRSLHQSNASVRCMISEHQSSASARPCTSASFRSYMITYTQKYGTHAQTRGNTPWNACANITLSK